MTSVTVQPVHRDVRGILLLSAVWVLVRGGRRVCRGFQRAVPLVGVLVPLPVEDAVELTAHRPR